MAEGQRQADEIEVALYKSLRTEVAAYLEKIPGLWLQKLTLVGLMISFLVTQYGELSSSAAERKAVLIAVILAVPVLAVLIDLKILEYGLHTRTLSNFQKASVSPSRGVEVPLAELEPLLPAPYNLLEIVKDLRPVERR